MDARPQFQHDVDEEFCEQFLFVWIVCIGGTVCVLGTVGNVLCLVMFHAFSQLGGSLLLLVQALAWADFLLVILYSVVLVWPHLAFHCCGGDAVWDFTMYAYAYLWPVACMTMTCDTWFIVLISVHRYRAVCYPLQSAHFSSPSRLRRHVIAATLAAVIVETPRFFEIVVVDRFIVGTNETKKHFEYTDFYYNDYYQLIYKSIISMTYKKYLPMVIITFAALRIVATVRRNNADLHNVDVSAQKQVGGRVTRTVLGIMITFLVTQLPACLYPIARCILDDETTERVCSIYNLYSQVADIIALVNPSVNFLIYVASWRSFRRQLVGCCCFDRTHRVIKRCLRRSGGKGTRRAGRGVNIATVTVTKL